MPNINRHNAPMRPMAENLASRGRYGDSMLVHMNPAEVQGLASLSPTGSLTRNPDTGQPEAFLPLLLGLLGSGLGGAGLLGGLGALGAGAIGSGLGSWMETGSLKEGIKSGLMSALMGKMTGTMLKGLGGGVTPAVDKAAPAYANLKGGFDPLSAPLGASAAAAQATSDPTLFTSLGNTLGFNPEGTAAGVMGGLDTTLGQAMDPTKGIIATGLVPGMTASGISWYPGPMESKLEDDDDDWGEGILRDRGFQAAPEGYRPGVDPEWDYYSNPFDVDVRPRQFKRGGLIG